MQPGPGYQETIKRLSMARGGLEWVIHSLPCRYIYEASHQVYIPFDLIFQGTSKAQGVSRSCRWFCNVRSKFKSEWPPKRKCRLNKLRQFPLSVFKSRLLSSKRCQFQTQREGLGPCKEVPSLQKWFPLKYLLHRGERILRTIFVLWDESNLNPVSDSCACFWRQHRHCRFP